MIRFLQSSRFPFVIGLLVGLGMVVAAVALGHFMRLASCPLCILQRMLYLLLAASAAIGLIGHGARSLQLLSGLLMLLSAATGVLVAGYQTYLQRFAPNIQCSGEAAWWELLVDWAGERWPVMFQANGLCSDPAWKILGLSLAECSLIVFILLLCVSARGIWRHLRNQ